MREWLVICMLLFAVKSSGQQRPHYSQYLQNMEVINPAYSGIYKVFAIKAGYRNQWAGLQDAPKTTYLTLHTPINFDKSMLTAGAADYGVEEPYTRSDKDGYNASDNHHGLGLIALNDQTGAINRSTINIAYSYHLALGDIFNLSVGVGAGASRIGLNQSKLKFEDPNDPVVNMDQTTQWTPDMNVGIFLYSGQLYVGASAQQVVKTKLSFSDVLNAGKQVPHFFATIGYRIFIREDFSVVPSVMFKNVKPTPMAYDLNLKINFRNNFWLGGSYRKNDAFSLLTGFTINRTLNFGYSYDMTVSQIKNINNGTQEFVLGINL